ncbi:MAG: peptidoglycan recognition protein family protein [Phycisphaerae bacterium]
MLGSRTIKSLTALVASMTVGTLVLMLLETAPIRPTDDTSLAAVSSDSRRTGDQVFSTEVPLKSDMWRNVVIHATGHEGRAVAEQSHFVLTEDSLVATDLWRTQVTGSHIFAPGRDWNSDTIGICLDGDYMFDAPDEKQFELLTSLVRTIQQACDIPADRVYLYGELVPESRSPGEAFPATAFNRRLLQLRR